MYACSYICMYVCIYICNLYLLIYIYIFDFLSLFLSLSIASLSFSPAWGSDSAGRRGTHETMDGAAPTRPRRLTAPTSQAGRRKHAGYSTRRSHASSHGSPCSNDDVTSDPHQCYGRPAHPDRSTFTVPPPHPLLSIRHYTPTRNVGEKRCHHTPLPPPFPPPLPPILTLASRPARPGARGSDHNMCARGSFDTGLDDFDQGQWLCSRAASRCTQIYRSQLYGMRRVWADMRPLYTD
jgi:hypothetical protein